MAYKDIKEWRRYNKEKLVQGFGGKCGVCGLEDHSVVYDFHHLDPTVKDFTLSSKIRSWKKIIEEAKKCVMLCAHCHRKHHMGVLDLPDDLPRFDETLIVDHKNDFYDDCPVCGNQKKKMNITCSPQCAAKRRNIVDWEKYNLRKLYEDIGSFVGISKIVGVSDVAVKKRMKKEGII